MPLSMLVKEASEGRVNSVFHRVFYGIDFPLHDLLQSTGIVKAAKVYFSPGIVKTARIPPSIWILFRRQP